ncbi:MAG: hypothetical protein ACYSU7_13840 [Planctomycetota bacterium]
MQRLGVSVEDYAVLNIHQIGIEAPASFVFEALMEWDEATLCWPGHLARLERGDGDGDGDGDPQQLEVYLFGRKKPLLGIRSKLYGLNSAPLFRMEVLKAQRVPTPSDIDNARYLLYRTRGGYAIGIFCVYVRSSIPREGEKEETQAFMVVGFNFYGRKDWPSTHIINRAWEVIHNRVTANILNRLKQLCEDRIQDAFARP